MQEGGVLADAIFGYNPSVQTAKRGDQMTFLDLARLRRSVRRFADQPIEPGKFDRLQAVAEAAQKAYGAAEGALLIADDPAVAERLRAAIVSGWQGKINLWLYVTKAPAFLIMLVKSPADTAEAGRPLSLGPISMVMETVVLAAAEMELGTCWIAGFNPAGVSKVLHLPPEWRPCIVSPLGYPTEKGRLEMISRTAVQADRRKPLEEIFEWKGGRS
jgi:nitroreductase